MPDVHLHAAADVQKLVMGALAAVKELVVIVAALLAVMHVLFNAEINVKQLAEHLATLRAKIVAKHIVMTLVNQLTRLLVQTIHQQAQRLDAEKIVLQDVIFIAQDVLVIALD